MRGIPEMQTGGMFCELPEPAFALVIEILVEALLFVNVVLEPAATTFTMPDAPVPP